MRAAASVLSLLLLGANAGPAANCTGVSVPNTLYNQTRTTLAGDKADFANLAGNVVLVTNVATF